MEFIFIHNNYLICNMVYKSCKIMNATDNFWNNFVVEPGMKIKKKYRIMPASHDDYKWESRDGRVKPIAEIDDMHLVNIYRMLKNAVEISKDALEHLSDDELFPRPFTTFLSISSYVAFIKRHLHHIAYEIHKRSIFINDVPTYKQLKKNVAERSENRKADKEV